MIHVFLRLGRISNLPTVWTNALAATALIAIANPVAAPVLSVLISGVALSLFYLGGMFLNDAFDAEYDRAKRADRPIPNGEISRGAVFVGGFGLMGAGLAISAVAGAFWAGLALALAVLAYDWLHKKTVLAPVIMGATRFLSYVLAAVVAAGTVDLTLLLAALGLFAHIVGLTYAAKNEEYNRIGAAWPLAVLAVPVALGAVAVAGAGVFLPFLLGFAAALGLAIFWLFRRAAGDVPRAVITMIAAISLYDATMIAWAGSLGFAMLCAAGFLLTLALQRVARGT